jgi:hypothetical protein
MPANSSTGTALEWSNDTGRTSAPQSCANDDAKRRSPKVASARSEPLSNKKQTGGSVAGMGWVK